MLNGLTNRFINQVDDINTPTQTPLFNVFWMIHSYLNLVLNTPNPTPGPGMVKLYSFRTGTLSTDTALLEAEYTSLLETNSKKVSEALRDFGNSAISYNLATLYRLVSNMLVTDIARGFGDDKCLTPETLTVIYKFCKFHSIVRGPRDQREDSIVSVVETCRYNAQYHTPGVSSVSEIITLIDTLDKLVTEPTGGDEYARRSYLMNVLRIIFYVGCRYYQVNLVRFTDQNIKRPYTRNLGINDFTLAAVPFDPTLVSSCADEGSTMSRFGVEYLQSLHAVLSALGGVECTVNFPAINPDDDK